MEGFIIILMVFGFLILLAKANEKPKKELSNKVVVFKKQCPPHQRFWQEIEDQNGVLQGARLVCKVCGPLKGQSGREDE